MNIPFVRPSPAKLSLAIAELQAMEQSGVFSNHGPINTRFEQEMLARFFGGEGACMTVCNATIGLMLAIKEVAGEDTRGKFALMPGFTFAAAAHAALWCGLTPLLCDIDAESWAADPAAESEMLARYAGKIAVIIPYATFGYPIGLERYQKLASQLGVPVVVDGAASLGTFDAGGRGFGTGFAGSVAFSMHATKSFAVGEAGLIYSADPARIARLRTMSSFGFGEPRTATMPGLNGKVSEVVALLGQLRLADYDRIVAYRAELFAHYRAALPELQFQPKAPGSQAHQFVPALLPSAVGGRRATIRTSLGEQGIATGAYFCPHLFEQPYFQKVCVAGRLPVCDDVSARIISLPLFDEMTHEEVDQVVRCLRPFLRSGERTSRPQKLPRIEKAVPRVYAAASRTSRRRRLAQVAHDAHLPPRPVQQQGQI
ncbi:MAG: DegT/DnrJ/EryC1/StrS aminotransferase family protein [Acidobacteriaceae bacterium]